MVFVCVTIRTPEKLVKPWFARTVLDGTRTLSDIFAEFSSGEFDQGDPIDDKYQTTQTNTGSLLEAVIMRYIENFELREWVKDSLRKTIFQKAHALAIQTGCEILVKLKDSTDDAASHQYYATGSLQKAYHNNVLRKIPGEMFVSGETGLPLVDQGIQSDESITQSLPVTSNGGIMGRVPRVQEDSHLRYLASPSMSTVVSTGSVAGENLDSSFPTGSSSTQSTSSVQTVVRETRENLPQPTDFESTVKTVEYGPECARDQPMEGQDDGDNAARIKVEPPDDDDAEHVSHSVISSDDGITGVGPKTESMSDDDDDDDDVDDAEGAHFGQDVDESVLTSQTSADLPPDASTSRDSTARGADLEMPESFELGSQRTGAKSADTTSKPYQCAVCHKAFRSIQVLQKHTQTLHRHGKRRVFPRGKSRSGKHVGRQQRASPQPALHSCTMCNQSFSQSILLNDHIVRAHLNLDTSNASAPYSVNPGTAPSQFSNSQADPQLPQITSVSSLQFPQAVNPLPAAASSYSQSPMAPGPSLSTGGSAQGQGVQNKGEEEEEKEDQEDAKDGGNKDEDKDEQVKKKSKEGKEICPYCGKANANISRHLDLHIKDKKKKKTALAKLRMTRQQAKGKKVDKAVVCPLACGSILTDGRLQKHFQSKVHNLTRHDEIFKKYIGSEKTVKRNTLRFYTSKQQSTDSS